MSKTKNQRTKILHYLQVYQSITPIQALNKFGCFRLSARIKELRDAGNNISTELVEINDSRVARYCLIQNKKNEKV